LVCQGSYCYFVDILGNLVKWNPITNTIVDAINEGQGSTCGRITIDECNSQIAGEELVWALDQDGSGGCNDFGMVSLSTFSGEKFYNGFNNYPSLYDEIECATENSTTYIGYKRAISTSIGALCGFERDHFVHQALNIYTINSSDELELVYERTDSYTGTTGSSLGTIHIQGDMEFVDYGDDGDLDVCVSQGAVGRTGCNGVNTYYSVYGHCYDFKTGVQERGGTGTATLPSNDFHYDFPVEQYVFDIDNDGKDEIYFAGFYVTLILGQMLIVD